MAGSMSLADLAADLRASLGDTAELFDAAEDADFKRLLTLALPDMAVKRPRTRLGQVLLQAGEGRYSLAALPDFLDYKSHIWDAAACRPQPWEPGYPGAVPRVAAQREDMPWLAFDPAPSAAHIALRGSTFRFYYLARHVLGEDASGTTVSADDRGLLLLRAQAEALRTVTLHQANKPVAMRDGLSGTPRNSTPAALHEMLLRLFWEAR